MSWTEREIQIAKTLQEPDAQAFIKKIFTEIQTSNGETLKKNVVALDDAAYGRLMKVNYLAAQENKARIDLIAKISKTSSGDQKKVAKAPR